MYDTSMISAFIAAGGGDQLPRITEHLLQTAGKDFSSGCGAAAFEVDAENLYAISFQSDSSATSMEFTTNGVSFTLPAQFSTQVGFNTSGAESSCLGELFAHYKNNPFPPSSRFKSNR